jgi:transposase-like protein
VVLTASRLTDEQKKKIVADYIECGSYRATARKNGVSDGTVRKIVSEDTDILQKFAQKKEENTLDMLAYMDSRKEQAQGVIDIYLQALADPEKLENATLSQIATALGIVVDKFTKNVPDQNNSMEHILKNMETMSDIMKKTVPNRNIEDYE